MGRPLPAACGRVDGVRKRLTQERNNRGQVEGVDSASVGVVLSAKKPLAALVHFVGVVHEARFVPHNSRSSLWKNPHACA